MVFDDLLQALEETELAIYYESMWYLVNTYYKSSLKSTRDRGLDESLS